MIKYGNKSTTSKVSRRFVKRTARRIPRSIVSTGVSLKVEYDSIIGFTNTASQPYFENLGNTFVNFSAILLANPAFVSQANNFIRYKITSSSFSATPCYSDVYLNTAFPIVGCPVICVQQYPSLTSQSIGDEVNNSDNNLVIKPNDLTQYKSWSYKSNFMIGTGSGVGTWNQCNQTAAQQGQFSARWPNVAGNSASALIYLYAVRMCLYVMLDGKTR